MEKAFILDTNTLMDSPESIEGFADNEVIITGTTLEELDINKEAGGEKGWSAQNAIKTLDKFMENAKVVDGKYQTQGGGTLRIEIDNMKAELPNGWSLSRPDNRILSQSLTIKKDNGDKPTIIITNDISMRNKARAVGMITQNYRNEVVEDNYSGRRVIELESKELIDQLHKNAIDASFIEDPTENEYFTLRCGPSNSVIARYRDGMLHKLKDFKADPVYKIKPRNSGQSFLMDALMAPVDEIPLVIAKGPAGTGKTFISLACGLDQCYGEKYESCYITRSQAIPEGEELGFLPGDLEEKIDPLLGPFWDGLSKILRMGEKKESKDEIDMQMKDLIASQLLQGVSMAYIRGRTFENNYIILDEAQNTTPTQLKTLISRAGEGTKLVILGDPEQIDTAKLTRHSNGLVYVSEKFKGSKLCAQIQFTEDECTRSHLATEAVWRL